MPRDVCTPILDGADTDFIYFRVASFSRRGVRHDITICKRTGEVRCKCEDAVCRKKRPMWLDLISETDVSPLTCKHVRELVRVYRNLLES